MIGFSWVSFTDYNLRFFVEYHNHILDINTLHFKINSLNTVVFESNIKLSLKLYINCNNILKDSVTHDQ